jgi:hypothetical protein
MTEPATLSYERSSPRGVPYRKLFVPLGIVVAVIEGAIGLFGLLVILVVMWSWVSGAQRLTQLPLDLCIVLAFSAVCSFLIVLGVIRSSDRSATARSYIRAGFAGLLLLAAVGALRLVANLSALFSSTAGICVIAVYVVRLGYVATMYWLYSSLRADLYYSKQFAGEAHPTMVPIQPRPAAPKLDDATRFIVSGFDMRTGEPTAFKSKAASEELARRSAIALGLDPARIEVHALDQRRAESDAGAQAGTAT